MGVNQLQFSLTGGSLNDAPIATATLTAYGWTASWNSTTVPNGTYTLESEATDGAGYQGVSTGVTVVVRQPAAYHQRRDSAERRLGVRIPRDPGRLGAW